ncbi:hypothetical protein AAF712_005011 [Marasmius tenuissimus]|uniref:Uncharacterized protein n=1 Tax=Marasmius tenuissimus TaxID=585030 RepID=A0ABR3A2G5_9AGAR
MNPYSAIKSMRGSRVLFSAAFVVLLALITIYIYALDHSVGVPSLKWSLRPPEKVSIIPPVFPMHALAPALMTFENSKRYRLTASEFGDAAVELDEWKSLLPHGNGTVYLDTPGGKRDAFTISLFHQLRCLDAGAALHELSQADGFVPVKHTITERAESYRN